MPKAVGSPIELPGRVDAPVHARDDPDEADRVDVEDGRGVDVVAGARRIAGHRQDVPDAERVGAQEVGLDAHEVPVAAGEVHVDVEARRLAHQERGRQDRHPDAPERAVVDVDDLDAALREELRALHELLDVVAARRIQLDRHQELAGVEPARGAATAPRSRPSAGALVPLRRDRPGHRHGAPRRARARGRGGRPPRASRGCAPAWCRSSRRPSAPRRRACARRSRPCTPATRGRSAARRAGSAGRRWAGSTARPRAPPRAAATPTS